MTETSADFVRIAYIAARSASRCALSIALNGTPSDRWRYCVNRACARSEAELATFGSTLIDTDRLARLAVRWFYRLELIAQKRKKLDIQLDCPTRSRRVPPLDFSK